MNQSEAVAEIRKTMEDIAEARGNLAYHKAMSMPGSFEGKKFKSKYLYFAACGDAVKIGVSSDPQGRIKSLQTGAPGTISILATIPDAGDRECEIHRRLSHLNIQGEWFRHTEEVDTIIGEIS